MSKSQLVRDIRRAVDRRPEWRECTAAWGRKPAWLIARRYSVLELMDIYHEIEYGRGDLLEDDDVPS